MSVMMSFSHVRAASVLLTRGGWRRLQDVIAKLNIPTSVPLVYQLDEATMKPIKGDHGDKWAPLSGRYLGDEAVIRAAIDGVANQSAKK